MMEQFDLLPFLRLGLINGGRSDTRMHFLWILLFFPFHTQLVYLLSRFNRDLRGLFRSKPAHLSR
jgi:hypothetical protein